MKFSQLIEYNIKNIVLEKSYTKCREKTSPKPFSGKLKMRISLNQLTKLLYSLILLYPKLRAIKNKLKISYRSIAFTSY